MKMLREDNLHRQELGFTLDSYGVDLSKYVSNIYCPISIDLARAQGWDMGQGGQILFFDQLDRHMGHRPKNLTKTTGTAVVRSVLGQKKMKKSYWCRNLSKPAILGGTRDKPRNSAKTTCFGTRDSRINRNGTVVDTNRQYCVCVN
jgi:hypothetical protein